MKIYPKFKKVLSFVLTFSILLSIIPTFSLTVSANTVNVLDGKISISDSANSISQSNGIVTITAKGSLFSKKTNNITIINNSGKNSILSFDYSATKYSSFTINETGVQSASGTHKQQLAPGGTVVIKIISNSGLSNTTATLTLSNFTCIEVIDSSEITFQHDSNLGSITVGGQNVTDENNVFSINSDGATIVATPKSGNVFVGWFDASDNSIISQNKSFDIVPSKSEQTIKAIFKSSSSNAMFLVNGILYADLNVAVTKGNKVILIADGTLPAGDYNIPSGVTLLIPFDDSHTSYGSDPETIETPSNPTSPVVYRTLTLSDGATITVNGNIEVAAKHYASHGGSAIGGRPSKEYGYIVMEGNSKIILNSGANLYAWGYISGSDQAEVIAESGATIYEKMQVADYRGGSATVSLAANRFFPFSQYYVQNVEVHETIKYGANLICHAGIYASSIQEMPLNFMGTNAMFTLEEGASATKFYDVNTDRLIIDVSGNFSFNPITISFRYLLGTKKYNTKDFVLPLNQNITINIKSGTSTINQDIMLQPGTTVNIEDGAKLNLLSGKKVYLMDSDDWDKYCFGKKLVAVTYVPTLKAAPNIRTENNIQDAKVNINGTLIVDGAIFATSNHASIVSAGKTGVIQFNSAVIEKDSIIQNTANDDSGKVTISMTPVLLTNGNTAYPTTDTSGTAANKTYYYNTDCDMWVTHGSTGHNGGNNAGEVTKEPTCTEKGEKQLTCICGHSYTEEVDPLGHSYNGVITTDPTCTEKGVKTFTCSACGDFYTVEVDPLGHSYSAVVTAPTCTEKGYTTYTCSHCGDSYVDDYVDATGHDYEAVVTPPTCNDRGYTTYTCHCGDSYVVDYVDATGHDYEAVVTPPTCNDEGYTTYTCHCGDTYTGDKTSALGHKDDDHNHVCDNGCDVYQGTHADSPNDNDHVCDYGCGAVLEECVDTNKDHKCDNGCDKVYGVCEDTDYDHKCDYGCDKVHGTCEDKDHDHACDYGCDKVYGTCEDKDLDHKCDYGCDKVYGTCEDKDHDHKCDYGCDKVYGVCEDTDYDHKCDYGCDKTYGEHSDSDDDKDHLCDYCKEKVEECHGGKATCTEDAICVECGEVYEKALGHSFDNELDVSCNRDGCDFTREAYIGDVSYATFEDALAAAKEGDTIVVLSKIVIEGERTLDLTGITIDSKYVDFDNYAMVVKGNLTINGGSFNFDNYYGIGVTGKFTVNGGKFTTTKDYYLIGNFGETVINGGEFEALYCNVNSFAGTVNITGGKFTVTDYSYPEYPPCDVFAEDGGEAIITGGDFSTDVTNYCPDGHTVENNDGRFIYGEHVYNTVVTAPTCTEKGFTTHTCTVCGDSYTDNETAATGHSFDDDFDADCNNGCGHVREAKTLVAMIGNTKFDSLSEAVNTAKNGETIVLFKDVVLTEKLNVESTQKWDFGNYTVTLADVNDNYGLVVTGDLTIESGNFVAPGLYGIGVTGKLTVNGGMFKTTKDYYLIGNFGETVINGGEFEALYCNVNSFAGTVNITGGKFTVTDYSYPDYPPSDVFAEDGGEAIITGGDFSTDVTNYCPDGHTVENNDGRFIYGEHVYTTVVTKPTCTEKGHTTYTCECGDTYVDSYVDANGHEYDAVVTDPTCTEGGYTTHTCTVCGDTYVDSYVDANGHDYDDVITEPTCTEDGYTTHTCTVCGDTYVDSYVDESGHTHGGYEYDLYKHWSICSVDGCGVRFCEEDHVFIDDACKCGAKRVSVDKVGNTEINYTVIGQTVTVTHEDACTVVYISDGEYVKLDAVVNGDGSYSFTAPENVTEVQLFVIGDYDGNGALTEEDATSLRNALLGKETLNNTPEFIYDVNGDGKVTALDLALISAAAQRSIKLG